ncbi:hypothetical protein PGT21_001984 [Puccinia graminis f. sp. tritici]|uniref:Uncharacterized protein n=1 Tax=Puccinia graminis f. sp. tritici TaxID=56615 RepID=A0A5B0Q9P2_PUCGR|nr:hypothetical protein PGT21_001984 [Puccinia graminis f. sp. tritici]
MKNRQTFMKTRFVLPARKQQCNRYLSGIGSKCTPIPCIGIGLFFRSNPDLSDDWDQLGRSDTSRVGTWYRYRPSRSKDSPILYCGPPTLFGTGRRVGLGIDRTPPGLPHSSCPAAALRFVAGYLIWRPPTLVASPFKRRVVLGLERTYSDSNGHRPASTTRRSRAALRFVGVSPDEPQPLPLSLLLESWARLGIRPRPLSSVSLVVQDS